MRTSWMAFTLNDLAREREIYGKLSIQAILRPCWVAAIKIGERDPKRAIALIGALVIIGLQGEKRKAACGKQAAGAHGGADFVTTPQSLTVVRQLVNVP
jgi:hypothetical protein